MRYLQQTDAVERVELDVKDKKILSLLSQNARLTSTSMAKHVGLSRDAVRYRIGVLEKKGVLQGSRTIIDIGRFGYDAYHLFLQLSQPLPEIEQKLIKKFKGYPFIRAVLKFSGKYDFELALIAKNIKEFDGILDEVLHDCAAYLKDYEVLVLTKNYESSAFPKSFFDGPEKKKVNEEKKNDLSEVDEKDKEILSVLANECTLPFYEIAERVKISHDTASYRIKKLVRAGIILKFVPVINYASLGYNIYALLLRINGLYGEKEFTLRQFLQTDKNVLWAVKCVGRYNLLLYACVKNVEELHETLIKLRSHFPENVFDYEILIAYEEYKYTYFPDYGVI